MAELSVLYGLLLMASNCNPRNADNKYIDLPVITVWRRCMLLTEKIAPDLKKSDEYTEQDGDSRPAGSAVK